MKRTEEKAVSEALVCKGAILTVKYFATYKCPLCGKLLTPSSSVEIPYEQLPALLGKAVQNQMFAGNPYLHQVPMHVVCKCNDGNAGLAPFVGFVADNSSEKERIASNFLMKLIQRAK